MATDRSVPGGTLLKEPQEPPLAWLPAAQLREMEKRVTIGPTGKSELCIQVPGSPPRLIVVEFKGAAQTSVAPVKDAALVALGVDRASLAASRARARYEEKRREIAEAEARLSAWFWEDEDGPA